MRIPWRPLAATGGGTLIVLLLTIAFTTAVWAQSTSQRLVIRLMDVSAFPNVTLYVQGLGFSLDDIQLSVLEDGQEVEAQVQPATMGVQVAILLDASRSILAKGNSGIPRYQEAGLATRRFVELGLLDPQLDRLASYVARPQDGQLGILQTWTYDHQAAVDRLYLYEPKEPPEATPLHDLLFSIFDHFNQAQDVSPAISRAIVLFSDGLSGSSSLEITDAINRAQEENVPIFTVLLGRSETGERNMRRLATLTGGQFVRLDNIEDVDAIWRAVGQLREQLLISYRARSAEPRQVEVMATLSNGTTTSTTMIFPAVKVDVPTVTIVQPQEGMFITKEAPAFDTPLSEVEPRELPIQIQIQWPNGEPRAIRRVEYTVGTETRIVEQAPFDQIIFPINKLDTGRYTVRAVVEDELGLRAESPPVTFEVEVVRPPPPGTEPAVELTLGNRTVVIPRDRITMGINVLVLFVALAALFFALQKTDMGPAATKVMQDIWKQVTRPFRPDEIESAKAYLEVIDPGEALGLAPKLALREVTKIGRDPSSVHIKIPDSRVSRLHCTIKEESRGFVIQDEGSTAGTWVNGNKLGITDSHLLRDGDIIAVGPVRLRFVEKSKEPGYSGGDKDKTLVGLLPESDTLGRLKGENKTEMM
ncbi:MAG: FHA domain-containing protein [Ardenticatenia bacterium]|nr:FHA domain-containing protein [Ardenticatenia bacterium]